MSVVLRNNRNEARRFEARTSFVKWQKLAEDYQWGITNSSGIPLVYAIREDYKPPAPQTAFSSLKAKLMACTVHDG